MLGKQHYDTEDEDSESAALDEDGQAKVGLTLVFGNQGCSEC